MDRKSQSKTKHERPPAEREDGADFAAQLARSAFGRHYVDPRRMEQTLEDGAVVFRDRGRRGG